jgi:hypothetical protein
MHCMDIPFVFENVDLSKSVVGAAALPARMSQ